MRPFDAFVAFVALRASRVSRVCVACVAVLRQFLIFFINEIGPSKKIFPLRGQNPGEAPRTPLTRWACGAEARAPGDQW